MSGKPDDARPDSLPSLVNPANDGLTASSHEGAVMNLPENPPPPRLSFVRVLIAFAVIAGIAVSAAYAIGRHATPAAAAASTPRFAPYVDVTLTPTYPF